MLVKPRENKTQEQQATEKPKIIRTRAHKCVCNKCHKEQSYVEVTVPIQYGFNCKQKVLIDGIERRCAVCGWHVDDIATWEINRQIAEKMLQNSEQ